MEGVKRLVPDNRWGLGVPEIKNAFPARGREEKQRQLCVYGAFGGASSHESGEEKSMKREK
jgi:hypothetical protein